jgi:hypothetical protein
VNSSPLPDGRGSDTLAPHDAALRVNAMDDIEREDVLQAVDRAIAELLDRAKIVEPPVDAIALAEETIKELDLDPEWSEERRQWTAAHEIGRSLKSQLLEQLGVEGRGLAGASLANLVAARLLAPTAWFAADAPAVDYDLLELKNRYTTATHEELAWRILDLPEPCIITVLDDDVIRRRRGNALPAKRELSPAEKKCVKLIRQSNESQSVRQGAWTVQGWPIPRESGSRIILRSQVDLSDV